MNQVFGLKVSILITKKTSLSARLQEFPDLWSEGFCSAINDKKNDIGLIDRQQNKVRIFMKSPSPGLGSKPPVSTNSSSGP